MDSSDVLLLAIVLGFMLGPALLAWPLMLALGRWPGMVIVGVVFGGLGHLWSEDFGAAIGVYAALLAYVVDPFTGQRRRATKRRVAKTPVVPIAQAAEGALAAVEGRVAAGAQGTVQVPLAGGEAVWLRVTVLAEHVNGSGKRRRRAWRSEYDVVHQRPFELVGADGGRMRFELGDTVPWVDVYKNSVATFNSPSPKREALLKACGVEWSDRFGMNRKLRIEIAALRADAPGYACGIVQRAAGTDAPLTLCAPANDVAGLVVGGGDRTAVLQRLRGWQWH